MSFSTASFFAYRKDTQRTHVMPIALEAGKNRFTYVLKSDANKPNPPTWILRVLSARKFKEIASVHDAINSAGNGAMALDRILDAIRVALLGWESMATDDPRVAESFGVLFPNDTAGPWSLAYDPAQLDLVLSVAEAGELLGAAMRQGVTEADRKN